MILPISFNYFWRFFLKFSFLIEIWLEFMCLLYIKHYSVLMFYSLVQIHNLELNFIVLK